MLESRLNEDYQATHAMGLRELVLTSIKTGRQRVAGVYHKARTKDRGLMLNYCPFCGADIRYVDDRKAGTR